MNAKRRRQSRLGAGAPASRERASASDPLVDALDRVSADFLRRLVLGRALKRAGLEAIPAGVEDLTFFVSGPLYEAAAETLDEDYADKLLVEMAPILDGAWDHARKSTMAPPAPQPKQEPGQPKQGQPKQGQPKQGQPTSEVGRTHKHRSAVMPVVREEHAASSPVADTLPAEDEADLVRAEADSGAYYASSTSMTCPPPDSEPPLDSEPPPAFLGQDAITIPGTPSDVPPPQSSDLGEDPRSRRAAEPLESRDETPPPPRSVTVPYLDAVLTPPRRSRRVMLVDRRDALRRDLTALLESRGYAVITAHDRDVARTLVQRLGPALIVADVETVAPDFEPLILALEELLGDIVPSHPQAEEEPRPRVLLLGDGRRRSLPTTVDAVLEPRASESSGSATPPSGQADGKVQVDDVVEAVAALLPLERPF